MKPGFYQLCEIHQNAETMVLNQFLPVMCDSPKCRDNVMKPGFYQLCEIHQNAETMGLNQFLPVMCDSLKCRDNGIKPDSTSYV